MKKVYELVIVFKDGTESNLLYASKKRAIKDLNKDFAAGTNHTLGIIINSYIISRILF